MSVSDLQKLGLLRAESDWNPRNMRSYVPRLLWMVLGCMAIGGCVMLALGDGDLISWLGLIIFSVALLGFVWMNIASVNRALKHEDESGEPPPPAT